MPEHNAKQQTHTITLATITENGQNGHMAAEQSSKPL